MSAFSACTDLPDDAEVKLVGGSAELGCWDVAAAPLLKSLGGGEFGAAVAAGAEFKLVWRQAGAAEWRWLPGPNRVMPDAPLQLHWPAACDGTAAIDDDGYLEPQRGELRARCVARAGARSLLAARPFRGAAARWCGARSGGARPHPRVSRAPFAPPALSPAARVQL